jgi:hypothetical protein
LSVLCVKTHIVAHCRYLNHWHMSKCQWRLTALLFFLFVSTRFCILQDYFPYQWQKENITQQQQEERTHTTEPQRFLGSCIAGKHAGFGLFLLWVIKDARYAHATKQIGVHGVFVYYFYNVIHICIHTFWLYM